MPSKLSLDIIFSIADFLTVPELVRLTLLNKATWNSVSLLWRYGLKLNIDLPPQNDWYSWYALITASCVALCSRCGESCFPSTLNRTLENIWHCTNGHEEVVDPRIRTQLARSECLRRRVTNAVYLPDLIKKYIMSSRLLWPVERSVELPPFSSLFLIYDSRTEGHSAKALQATIAWANAERSPCFLCFYCENDVCGVWLEDGLNAATTTSVTLVSELGLWRGTKTRLNEGKLGCIWSDCLTIGNGVIRTDFEKIEFTSSLNFCLPHTMLTRETAYQCLKLRSIQLWAPWWYLEPEKNPRVSGPRRAARVVDRKIPKSIAKLCKGNNKLLEYLREDLEGNCRPSYWDIVSDDDEPPLLTNTIYNKRNIQQRIRETRVIRNLLSKPILDQF